MTERSKSLKWAERRSEKGPRRRPVAGGRTPDQFYRARIRVVLSGVSCRAGVGGRRGRERKRREEERYDAEAPPGCGRRHMPRLTGATGEKRSDRMWAAERVLAMGGEWVLFHPKGGTVQRVPVTMVGAWEKVAGVWVTR